MIKDSTDNRFKKHDFHGAFVMDLNTKYVYKNSTCCAKDLGSSKSQVCDVLHSRTQTVKGHHLVAFSMGENFLRWDQFDENGVCRDWPDESTTLQKGWIGKQF